MKKVSVYFCLFLVSALNIAQACENINYLQRLKNNRLVEYLSTKDAKDCLDVLLTTQQEEYHFKHDFDQTLDVVWENVFSILNTSNAIQHTDVREILLNNLKYIQLLKRKTDVSFRLFKKRFYYFLKHREFIDTLFPPDFYNVNERKILSDIYTTLFYIGFENKLQISYFASDNHLDLVYFLSKGILLCEHFSEKFIDEVFLILEEVPLKYHTSYDAENWAFLYKELANHADIFHKKELSNESKKTQEAAIKHLIKISRDLKRYYRMFNKFQKQSIGESAKTMVSEISFADMNLFSSEFFVDYVAALVDLYHWAYGREALAAFEESFKSLCDGHMKVCRELFDKQEPVSEVVANLAIKGQLQESIFKEHDLKDFNGKAYAATCSLEYIESLKNHLMTTKKEFLSLFFGDLSDKAAPVNIEDFILYLFKSKASYCTFVSHLEENYDYQKAKATSGLCSQGSEQINLYACTSEHETIYTVAKHEYVHYLQKVYFHGIRWVNLDEDIEGDTKLDLIMWLSEGSAEYLAFNDFEDRKKVFCNIIDSSDVDTWTIKNLIDSLNNSDAHKNFYSMSALLIMFLNDYKEGEYRPTFLKIRDRLHYYNAEDDGLNEDYDWYRKSRRENSYTSIVKPLLKDPELQIQFSDFIKNNVCEEKFHDE